MKVFVNEKSIPERLTDADKISTALINLIKLAVVAKKISNNQHIRRSDSIKNKEVLVGKTLGEYILELGNNPDPNKRKLKQLFLELFAKGPFLAGFHADGDDITDLNGKCLKNSCFDDAAACRTGAAVISVTPDEGNSEKFFNINSSVYGRKKILNICDVDDADSLIWVYQSNGKHEIPKDILVDGEVHSAMNLSVQDAQRVLSNGILIGKCIFNKINDQWYKFHCHGKNIYHGFPISIKTPYKEFSSAQILFDEIQFNEDGQLIDELLNFRGQG